MEAGRLAALVTGGSRGVGAATARELAEVGYDVVLTYRNKVARAEQVASAIAARGQRALPLQCDITQAADRERLVAALRAWTDHLDLLVLNASGGLERDLLAADPEYPLRINREAQVALLDAVLPLLRVGATVVFVTSHWAHRYGRVAQFPAYEPIAASKHAGEAALRARAATLAAEGVRLLVVAGDLIAGTITAKLLERAAPGLAAGRRGEVGPLPTPADLGVAIVAAATDPTLPSGHTIVVGGSLDSLPPLA